MTRASGWRVTAGCLAIAFLAGGAVRQRAGRAAHMGHLDRAGHRTYAAPAA